MIKRCIGIDLGSAHLHAVQLVRAERELRVEKVFCTQIRRSTDSLPEALRSLIGEQGFDHRATVAVSVPQEAVFFRTLEVEAAGLEQIRRHNWSGLEHHFPIPPGQIVAQSYSQRLLSDGRYSVLTAAVDRESLRQRCDLLAEAKLEPTLAEAAIFAVHRAVAVNHPDVLTGSAVIAYADESYLTLAVTQDNDLLLVRNVRLLGESDSRVGSTQQHFAEVLSREVQVSWRKVFATGMEPEGRLYLALGSGISAELQAAVEEKLPGQTVFVDPYANVKAGPDGRVDGSICLAQGLALRELTPERTAGVNFLQAEQAGTKPSLNLKKELTICAVLAGAIVICLLVGLRVRLFYMERSYARIRNEIRDVFRTTLPEEKNVVNPLVQLEQKIQSFQKDYQLFAAFHPTEMAPLQVLQRISASMPSSVGFKVDDLLVTPSSVRVSGTCPSFEPVYQWQQVLQQLPGFALVEVDAQKEPQSGAVSFTILISSDESSERASDVWQTAALSP